MKTLYLVRHAKSSRDDPSLPDRERPLNDRGRQDAPAMGKRLCKRGVKPDLLVSSPALRALTTAQLIADEIGYQRKDIIVDERLYASSPDDLLTIICAIGDQVARVMLFGHNPEFTDLAHRLSSEVVDMPTCAVAEFLFDAKVWADVAKVGPAKVKQDAPKK
ncbi:histidine phosphatase family protein [Variovorax sp. J31P207]|uniref:SixA phosphatase family protein n=1 Tax=Variovorax sp. J31P207 TaxID=3053510 RepID=UPI0025790CA4|nr:histidine phosphatase family protein [Variovorax sp. J31P207]MDM0070667.1 histidine phosphatase family protein [Variovorax sp. J31P207]